MPLGRFLAPRVSLVLATALLVGCGEPMEAPALPLPDVTGRWVGTEVTTATTTYAVAQDTVELILAEQLGAFVHGRFTLASDTLFPVLVTGNVMWHESDPRPTMLLEYHDRRGDLCKIFGDLDLEFIWRYAGWSRCETDNWETRGHFYLVYLTP